LEEFLSGSVGIAIGRGHGLTPGWSSSGDRAAIKAAIAERIRLVRHDLYGQHGGPMLADALNLPHRIWHLFELGETIPAHVLLRFLELTSVEPNWLYTGRGARYRRSFPNDAPADDWPGDAPADPV
jgi:hypothetical protein